MEGEREMVLTSLALVKIRNFPKNILKTPLPGSVPRLLLSRVFFSLNAYDFTQNGGQESGHLGLTKPCGSLRGGTFRAPPSTTSSVASQNRW